MPTASSSGAIGRRVSRARGSGTGPNTTKKKAVLPRRSPRPKCSTAMAIRSVSPMADGETATLVVALLAAFTFAGLVFALLYPYVSGEKQTEKRVASVTETRAKKAATGIRSAADIAAQRKKQV